MSTAASDLYQQNAGISAINSGPIVIRTYNDLSGNNTYFLGKYDIPISSNYVLITSTGGKLVPSNAIYVSSITTSTLTAVSSNISTLNVSTLIAVSSNISTLNVSTLTAVSSNISTLNTNILTTSTFNVSTMISNASNTITVRGSVFPSADITYGLGSGSFRFTTVYASGGVITTSDSSEKDLILLPYGLNEVMQVKTIMYKWKSQALLPDTDLTKHFQYYGICADQLSAIFPELVYNEDPNVPMQLNYSELIPVVIKAIQEQNDSIQQLHTQTQKINKLELELSSIKSQIEQFITNSK